MLRSRGQVGRLVSHRIASSSKRSTACLSVCLRQQEQQQQSDKKRVLSSPWLINSSRYLSSTTNTQPDDKKQDKTVSMLDRLFGPKAAEIPLGQEPNRWLMVLPAIISHMCIGSPYGWSIMSATISRELGFVTASAADWGLGESTLPISLVFALQGISAAIGGSWAMRVGPRKALTVSAFCFGGGLMIGGAGVAMHSLPLLYAGYGFLGGCGVGLAYTPPLQALISWFPDKRGLASGMCIAGFGSGALIFAPLANKLMDYYSTMPTYLGPLDQVQTIVRGGKVFAEHMGQLQEVVYAGAVDVSRLTYDLAEGVYVVGSGNTGAASALMTIGGIYGVAMLFSAAMLRTPAPGYKPAGWEPAAAATPAASSPEKAVAIVAKGNVTPNEVMRTSQFYLLGTSFFCLAAGGISLLSVAKPMMSDIFTSALPGVVTAAFAGQYVQIVSAANLGGRLGWASFSDRFGRRATFHAFTLGSIPLYLSVPFLVEKVVTTGSSVPLYGFIGTTFAAVTIMGGTYAVMPAYESDLFGTKYVGPTHGRMLLASAAAALAGPSLLMKLKGMAEKDALIDLLSKVDPLKFEKVFGSPLADADQLIASKTVTINRLLQILPADTVDPSPFLYNTTMYSMAALMGVAAITHAMVKPVDPKHYEKVDPANVVEVQGTPKDVAKQYAAAAASGMVVMTPSMASHMIPSSILPIRKD